MSQHFLLDSSGDYVLEDYGVILGDPNDEESYRRSQSFIINKGDPDSDSEKLDDSKPKID